MLKFFRKIRQTMISKNKVSKYLLYAIGEIALVMIGILLALQVNTWNENRKATTQEIKILSELKNDLETNFTEIKGIHDYTNRRRNYSTLILDYFENKKSVDDSLKVAFEIIQLDDIFNNANTTYKFIENQGVDIINNDDLRIRITEMCERQFNNITTREATDLSIVENQLQISMNELFMTSLSIDSEFEFSLAINTPKSIELLRENNTFKNIIVRLQNFLILRFKWQKQTIIDLEQLIIDVQKEIDRLSI
ncbi:DUF6090 family protein [Winogradskyella immobilis]|uniref:PilJ/NarX-like methyl-accepting chemotaxis transducer n=1 Tax=Winogradskyella immobilis TaxID=2816852 RepID=A0ABS8EMW6_9FLAO|nr:DUF6090 family protein [Winogradskyella immobilis]MCC1484546.1 hypothetical protein [Winogradskyella immobilis]MCG0016638.1 hypothetical protein [Winogradskyella immobilis]